MPSMENFIQILQNVCKQPLARRNVGKDAYLWYTESVIELYELLSTAFLTRNRSSQMS